MASNTIFIGSYQYNENGVLIPDTADVQADVQQEYRNALGADLSLEESTPQGRLIDVETTARQNTIRFNALMANTLINIYMSSGSALDAWGSNFDVPRNGATSSQTDVTVTGTPGTIIPADSQAAADDGSIWLALNEIIIGETGTAQGVFYSQNTGAIALGIGELTSIVSSTTTGVVGWETITNTTAAVLGQEVENDLSYRQRIINSIFNGSALFGNYSSSAFKVDGVRDVFAYDNPYGASMQLDNITIPPHSVYVCVDGGNSEDVAYALYETKSAGAGWCGNTTVTVQDKTYSSVNTVTYQIPVDVPVSLQVFATSLQNSSSDLTTQIQNTIINYAQGLYSDSGYGKLGIRALISPFTIASMLNSQIQGINVNRVNVGMVTPAVHAVVSIKKASVTSGVLWASVDSQTFAAKVGQNGTYNFTYNGTNWLYNNSPVDLATYGITVTANNQTPANGDLLSVVFADGNMSEYPINLFATEVPQFSAENIQVTING